MTSAALALFALAATANAQRASSTSTSGNRNPSPEIGLDAAATFSLEDNGGNVIQIPAQRIRMGFFMSPKISIEPSFGLQSIGGGGGDRLTVYTIGAGLLYHLSASRQASQFYVRPFVDLLGVSLSGGDGDSDTETALGIGAGIKFPLRDRIASRFEANFAHADGSNTIGLLAGLSFYTR